MNNPVDNFFESRMVEGKCPLYAVESKSAYLNASIVDISDVDNVISYTYLPEEVIKVLKDYHVVDRLAVFTTRYVVDDGLTEFRKLLDILVIELESHVIDAGIEPTLFYVSDSDDNSRIGPVLLSAGFKHQPNLDHECTGIAYTRNL